MRAICLPGIAALWNARRQLFGFPILVIPAGLLQATAQAGPTSVEKLMVGHGPKIRICPA